MDAHNSLHYQAQTLHRLNAELIAQHFAMVMLLTLALGHLHNGTRVGFVCAVLGIACGYTTWRSAVEGFGVIAVTTASLTGIAFAALSLIAYMLA